MRENREIPQSPAMPTDAPSHGFAGWWCGAWRAVRETLRRQSLDARSWEVRQARTACEAADQPRGAGAEVVEGRGLPEGNTAREPRPGLSAGQGVSSDLGRVRQVARNDKDVRFTALLHHVDVDRLREAYRAILPRESRRAD
jgi:hypothetical protein